jgi:hypothetical protein
MFGQPVRAATSVATLACFKEEVVKVFGWPRAVYSDNGSHFTGGVFPAELKDMRVHHFLSPIRYPSSVGLAERYVQIMLKGLQAALQDDPEYILQWDRFVEQVTRVSNTRTTKVHGFTPSKLLYGFIPSYSTLPVGESEQIRTQVLMDKLATDSDLPFNMDEINYHARLAMLDEIRNFALNHRFRAVEDVLATEVEETISEGDLVLLRRLALDNQKGRKLEPHWEGPYVVDSVNYHKKSVQLKSLHKHTLVGKYHVNDVKKFIMRSD